MKKNDAPPLLSSGILEIKFQSLAGQLPNAQSVCLPSKLKTNAWLGEPSQKRVGYGRNNF